MKICVLGNSHITALKLGWPQKKGVDVTFFGGFTPAFDNFEFQGSRIIPTADLSRNTFMLTAKQAFVELKDYDEVWVVGNGITLARLMLVFARHRLLADARPDRQLISEAVFNLSVKRLSSFSAMKRFIRTLSEQGLPVTLIPAPMPSENILESEDMGDAWKKRGSEMLKRYEAELAELAKLARIVMQPASTLATPYLTKSEYSVGSVKMSGQFNVLHEEDDYVHMNAKYGGLVIKEALLKKKLTKAKAA